jgi:predicted alpha/beta superfamily hydrolase
VTTACATPPETAAPGDGAPVQLATSYTLHSQVLGEDREINVWTPPGYAAGDARHTVLYLIDGGLEQDFPHIAGLGQLGAVSYTYEQLIIVGVKTGTRIAELTPPATDARYQSAFANAGGAARFRDYLRAEVIPFIEARYRAGERRAIIGESLAGLFVIDTLASEPALFNDYIAVSPSLWWDDRIYARAAAQRIGADTTPGRRLYLSLADEGGTMLDGVNLVRAAADAAPDERLALRFADRSAGETHATTFHPAALDALRWLYAAPPYDYGPAPWWMTEGASPPPAPAQ